jgi:hypothetical protein
MIVATPPPIVRLVPASTAVLGTRFRAGETVTVRLTVGKIVRIVRTNADARGAFRARFSPLLALDVCHGKVVVTATGTAGDSARFVRECATPDPAAQ